MSRLVCLGLVAVVLSAGSMALQAQETPPGDGSGVDATESTDSAEAELIAPIDGDAAGDTTVTRTDEMIDMLRSAGYTGVVLVLLSVAGLAFALERLVGLRRGLIVPNGLAGRTSHLVQERKLDDALAEARRSRSTLGRVIAVLIEHRDCSADIARTIANDVGGVDLKIHHQRNYPLAVVGTLAPLLGLLGTVFGMIRAFQDVAAMGSMGNAQVLASGIYQALVTTAMGLVIAVPALALYHFFKTRIVRHTIRLEEETTELIRRWFVRGQLNGAGFAERSSDAAQPGREPVHV